MNLKPPIIAIAGSTGAVGTELLCLLDENAFPYSHITLYASTQSAGSTTIIQGNSSTIQDIANATFDDVDIVFFCTNTAIAKTYIPQAINAGSIVIDNSALFRMQPDVPLVIPEVNVDVLTPDTALIANPNCTTIILLTALEPIRQYISIKRIVVCTYQAVSGAGASAMQELRQQTADNLNGSEVHPGVFIEPCAFNVFSHDSQIREDGYNIEEHKIVEETRKIWDDESIQIAATCIRVPVMRTHCEAINLTLDKPVSNDDLNIIRTLVSNATGVQLVDDATANQFPTSKKAENQNNILIGRLRLDRSQLVSPTHSRGIELFIAGDQLRKGAALNAIQIATHLKNYH